MSRHKFKKAGIVIYGTNKDGKRAFIMPYSEGRFGYGDKYYVLPKGTIDPNENDWAGAKRETLEETGIDIDRLMRNGYAGVKVIHNGHEPVDFTYISRGGVKRRTALYGIEVQGIENLAPYLKNRENAGTPDFKVKESIKVRIDDADRTPQFSDFLEWLRSGRMPPREWNKYITSYRIPPLYPVREGKETPFERIERRVMKDQKIETPEQWKAFWRYLPSRDYEEMKGYLTKIKDTVQAIGVTKGDADIFKLDDKDTPLQFFQEGADIITAEDYLAQCGKLLAENVDYRLGFGGGAANHSKYSELHSQLAGIGAFVDKDTLQKAGFEGLAGLHGQKQEHWISRVKNPLSSGGKEQERA